MAPWQSWAIAIGAVVVGCLLVASRIRPVAIVGVVVVVMTVVFAIQVGQREAEVSMPRLVLEHAPAPDFTLKGLDGKAITSYGADDPDDVEPTPEPLSGARA